MEHYLDNSATTQVSRQSAQKAFEIMTQNYGNPSSLHYKGLCAEKELNTARKLVASSLGAMPEEIFFTSGGTESNNTALFGTANAKKRVGNRIIISAIEHSSIMETANVLENNGFEVIRIKPNKFGEISVNDVLSYVNDKTILVSIMSVNNEIGSIMPIKDIFNAVKNINNNIVCHTDAVQAFGKININVKKLNADLLSVSAHKVHAPKGCGVLFVKKKLHITPHQYGGEQEKHFRPGTEALPLIGALGVAVKQFDIENNLKYVEELNLYARQKLLNIKGISINSPENALAYVLNISAGRVRSETMLHFLEEEEIYVSSGSACAKGKPSYVLSALGIEKDNADSALRISFSKYNNKEDINALCNGIEKGLKFLVHR